jgi:hypothetical protein
MLYLAGTINSVTDPPTPLLAVGHAIGAMFPAMLFAGAVAFRDDGPMPRFPFVCGVLLGALRFGLTISGHEAASNAVTVPLELPFATGAAYVTWQAARRRRERGPMVSSPVCAPVAASRSTRHGRRVS